MAPDDEARLAAAEEREDAHLAALEQVGTQVEAMAATGQELVDVVRDERHRERRRDILLGLLLFLIVLKLISEGLAWRDRQDIGDTLDSVQATGEDVETLATTINRCINPGAGEEPDCGQDRSGGGAGGAAAQAVTAINHYIVDVAYCQQGGVAPDELEACAQQRQIERQGEDGGQLPPGP